MPTLAIRSASFEDTDGIRDVLEAAFPTPEEADLVEVVRAAGGMRVELVAALGDLVGTVAFTPVRVTGPSGPWMALGLGPLAVAPPFQRQGIGAALVREGLSRCRGQGEAVVFVLGDPGYYARFGFGPAAERGLSWTRPTEAGAFQVVELEPGALAGRGGVVRYLPAFEGVSSSD